jgi:hypothetical protein
VRIWRNVAVAPAQLDNGSYGPPAGAWLAGSDELGGLEQIRQTHPVQHLGAEPVEHGE